MNIEDKIIYLREYKSRLNKYRQYITDLLSKPHKTKYQYDPDPSRELILRIDVELFRVMVFIEVLQKKESQLNLINNDFIC